MAAKSKFIQITATSNQVFALDTAGDVWVFDVSQDEWRLIPTTRQDSPRT